MKEETQIAHTLMKYYEGTRYTSIYYNQSYLVLTLFLRV